jgi:hypothetical protein
MYKKKKSIAELMAKANGQELGEYLEIEFSSL